MRVLLFSRYSSLGASSRVRSLQYIPFLKEQGIHVTPFHLLGDRYLKDLYDGRRHRTGRIAASYWRRALKLIGGCDYDVAWIEGELFPWMPSWGESLLKKCRTPLVVDYDDALFHRYDMHDRRSVRRLLGRKVDRIMGMSSLVITGNEYLARRAFDAGAGNVAIIPSVIDLERYPRATGAMNGGGDIGWIGTPGTVKYLDVVREPLSAISRRHGVRLVTIGARVTFLPCGSTQSVPWSYERESQLLEGFSIGIMPLEDTPWEKGKCGYKIIQYMAAGLPVVASGVGANNDIIQHGVDGFLASSSGEWMEYLERLITDPGLRESMGAAGRRKVESRYSIQVTAPRLAELLLDTGGRT